MIFKTQIMQISKFNGNKFQKIKIINQAKIKIHRRTYQQIWYQKGTQESQTTARPILRASKNRLALNKWTSDNRT